MTRPKGAKLCQLCGAKFKRRKGQKYCSSACALWDRVDWSSQDSCWNWKGSTNTAGYGEFRFGGVLFRSHRLSHELYNGKLGSLFALHTCDNPRCVNPSHLVAGTQQDNMQHMAMKGRSGNRKLSDADIVEIRSRIAGGETQQALGDEFGVSQCSISKIKLQETYRYVDNG